MQKKTLIELKKLHTLWEIKLENKRQLIIEKRTLINRVNG